mmetsp:Transcript_104644/g.335359  ORF Transcript_104644/g.335359 Transcript_104644/m.335359 type:complete len:239 (-) Transcript_104644:1154-1870(-)
MASYRESCLQSCRDHAPCQHLAKECCTLATERHPGWCVGRIATPASTAASTSTAANPPRPTQRSSPSSRPHCAPSRAACEDSRVSQAVPFKKQESVTWPPWAIWVRVPPTTVSARPRVRRASSSAPTATAGTPRSGFAKTTAIFRASKCRHAKRIRAPRDSRMVWVCRTRALASPPAAVARLHAHKATVARPPNSHAEATGKSLAARRLALRRLVVSYLWMCSTTVSCAAARRHRRLA